MERESDHWTTRLPHNLLTHLVWPVRTESHHDAGVPASKWRGYDALGLLCWYRHRFSQWDAALDDDDQPRAQLLREEHFEAWRSLTGEWVRRVTRITGDGRDDGVASDSGFEVVAANDIPRL